MPETMLPFSAGRRPDPPVQGAKDFLADEKITGCRLVTRDVNYAGYGC